MASLSEETLRRAIRIEIRARDFYSVLSAQIQDRRGRGRMRALSRSEEHHKELLMRRFRSLLGKDYSPVMDQDGITDAGGEDPNILGEHVFTDQASALEVVSFAIGLEDRAAHYYLDQLENVDDPRDVRLLKRLFRFETRHKEGLQAEYSRLNSSFYWIPEV
jgi:rubrerythrin